MKSPSAAALLACLLASPALALAADATPTPAATPASKASDKAPAMEPGVPVAPVDVAHLPEVIAKVNGTDIKRADLEDAYESLKQQAQMVGQSVPADKKDEVYRGLLDNLINTELLAQEAKARGITVADKDVDDAFTGFKDQFPSEEVFRQTVAQRGMTEAQVKSDVRVQLAIKKLLEREVFSKITIDDASVERFYKEHPDKFQEPEQVHAAHVLIAVDKSADPKTRSDKKKKAEQVLADAKAGKDFGELARANSDDPGSKDKGGDLGLFARGEMVKAFEDAAFAMKPGDISEVVETPYGYHVIKVIEKKPGRSVPLSEVHADLSDYLKKSKAGELGKKFVDGLRKKAKVQVFI